MPDPVQDGALPPGDESSADPEVEVFYGRTLTRIRLFMAVIGTMATIIAAIVFGWRIGIGVLCGCVVGWVNFAWLKQAINTIAEKAAHEGRPSSAKAAVAKSVLRYALIGIAAYVIFLVSQQSFYGFLGGLFVAVAAILCEAAFETFVALRQDH